jgi:hypothetical protein
LVPKIDKTARNPLLMMAMAYSSICNFVVFSAMLKTVDGAVGDTGRKETHSFIGWFTLSSAEQTCSEYKPGWILVIFSIVGQKK